MLTPRARLPRRTATTGEAAGVIAGAVGRVVAGLVGALCARPVTVASAAICVWVVICWGLAGALGAFAALTLVALGAWRLLPLRAGLARVSRWESRRSARHRARVAGRRVARRLGLADPRGRPWPVWAWLNGGVLTRLELVAPVADDELRRRFGDWAATLRLPARSGLELRPGRHAGHRVIEVRRPPVPLPAQLGLPLGGDLEVGLVLGVREDGEPWTWTPGRDGPHLLVTGVSGSGKSVLARRVVSSWAEAGGELVGLDAVKGTAWTGLPGRRAITKPACESVLADVVDEMHARYETLQRQPRAVFTPVLVAVEEVFALLDPLLGRDERARLDQQLTERIGHHLAALALTGREARFHLLAVAQRGDSRVLGGGAARDQFTRVVLLRNASDATLDLGVELSRTSIIPGREPPVTIRDLPAPPGRVLVRSPDDGYILAQVATVPAEATP